VTISAWPFLISRARVSGHREVVIPKFMEDTPLAEILPQVAGADETPAGHAIVREIHYPGVGPLSAVFRVFRATQAEFGLGTDGLLLDGSSRPILAVEGLVIRESARACERAGLSQADIDRAHQVVVPSYQRFWQEDQGYPTQTSVQIKAATPGQILILSRGQAWKATASVPAITTIHPRHSVKRRIVGVAVAAAAAALAAAVVNHVLSGGQLMIGPLAAGLTSCTNHGQNYENTGDAVSEYCRPSGTSVTVSVFRFGTAASYYSALKREISTMPSGTGPACPPGRQEASGSTTWQNRANPHPGQRLYCWHISSGQPAYLWTAPTADSFAVAMAPTYADIQPWWQKYRTSAS
jgi:hypothetical protein